MWSQLLSWTMPGATCYCLQVTASYQLPVIVCRYIQYAQIHAIAVCRLTHPLTDCYRMSHSLVLWQASFSSAMPTYRAYVILFVGMHWGVLIYQYSVLKLVVMREATATYRRMCFAVCKLAWNHASFNYVYLPYSWPFTLTQVSWSSKSAVITRF